MTFNTSLIIRSLFYFIILFSISSLSSCDNDDDSTLQTISFEYQFHNGQAVPSAPYLGIHSSDLSATLMLDELENGNTNITVSIQNTINGETYHTHAHDAADPSSTTNGTPYSEAPNADIFVQPLQGNGGTVSISQEANMSFDDLTSSYEGFFVIHDPLQTINTADIGTYVVVGNFARNQSTVNYASSVFQYDFNTGQLVPDFAYSGTHPNNLSASITVDELFDDKSRITVQLMNTIDGETYHTHAHDVADPATTPNGTPYNETPNGDVFIASITGKGGIAGRANISPKSHDEITLTYEGFFVVHDPLQSVSTVDPTTYVLLESFAR